MLNIYQAGGKPVVTPQELNRDEVNKMFELLLKVTTENHKLEKFDRLYNVDEIVVHLNIST